MIASHADPADFQQAVAHALRFDGRKRIHRGDAFMAELMAQHLAEYLAELGFVVMKRPPLAAHSSNKGLRTPGLKD